MGIPAHCRQWDIYQANLGGHENAWIVVVSSGETNQILKSTVVACEVIAERGAGLFPLNVMAEPADTGLAWPATVAVRTLASLPRNRLVSLDGRLEPVRLRTAVLGGLAILFGMEPWP